jgi:tRNA/rRNA methyltransferase
MYMDHSTLNNVRIVLVEPAGPLNVGAIARVMKNMGLQQLVLVNPQCDPKGAEAYQMAVHADDILTAAQHVESIPAALVGCQQIVATSSRDRSQGLSALTPAQILPQLLDRPSALIFGPEDRGLSNIELNYAQHCVRIPTSSAYPSLNLAQAVGICCHELYSAACASTEASTLGAQEAEQQIFLTADSLSTPSPGTQPCRHETLEAYYQHLETVLLQIGYLHTHTAASRMAKFRQLFNRSQPSESEVALLRGILSQFEWALSSTVLERSEPPTP